MNSNFLLGAKEKMNTGNGKFIVIEGPDGVGKSTAVSYIAEQLRSKLRDEVITVRLPGGTEEGERIRRLFKQNADRMSTEEQVKLLISAKRHLLDEVVRPAIQNGSYVIADRYIDSLLAYQWGGFNAFDHQWFTKILDELLLNQIDIAPDLKIVLECSTDEAERRMRGDARNKDVLDAAPNEFKLRVRTYYEHFLKESPCGHTFFVDSSGDVSSVEKQLRSIISRVL